MIEPRSIADKPSCRVLNKYQLVICYDVPIPTLSIEVRYWYTLHRLVNRECSSIEMGVLRCVRAGG